MNSPFPFSFSSLNSFENCARQHYFVKVAKKVKQETTSAIKWGTDVHTALENRVKDGTPMPSTMAPYAPVAEKIMAAADKGHKVFTEHKYAIDASFQPVEWKDPAAWSRCIVDVAIEAGNKLVTLDYKTGKRRIGSDQLKLSAAIIFHHKPHIESIDTGYVWLKEGNRTDSEHYDRADLPGIWNTFLPRVQRMQLAFAKDAWPPNPSGLCGWCPLTRADCMFSKKAP